MVSKKIRLMEMGQIYGSRSDRLIDLNAKQLLRGTTDPFHDMKCQRDGKVRRIGLDASKGCITRDFHRSCL